MILQFVERRLFRASQNDYAFGKPPTAQRRKHQRAGGRNGGCINLVVENNLSLLGQQFGKQRTEIGHRAQLRYHLERVALLEQQLRLLKRQHGFDKHKRTLTQRLHCLGTEWQTLQVVQELRLR